MHIMNALQIGLNDLDVACLVSIDLHVELVGEGGQIHGLCQVELGQRLLTRDVKSICQIFEAHQNLVLR